MAHMPARNFQTLAAKKLSRAREYAAIYPEACFVFIGDNGQVRGGCAPLRSTLNNSLQFFSVAPALCLWRTAAKCVRACVCASCVMVAMFFCWFY